MISHIPTVRYEYGSIHRVTKSYYAVASMRTCSHLFIRQFKPQINKNKSLTYVFYYIIMLYVYMMLSDIEIQYSKILLLMRRLPHKCNSWNRPIGLFQEIGSSNCDIIFILRGPGIITIFKPTSIDAIFEHVTKRYVT